MDNKSILLTANALISQGNYEGFLDYCTNDTQWNFIGEQILSGKEAVRNYMKNAYKEPPQFELETTISEQDYVTAIGKITMKDENGKPTDYSYCDVWQFRNGKMAASGHSSLNFKWFARLLRACRYPG